MNSLLKVELVLDDLKHLSVPKKKNTKKTEICRRGSYFFTASHRGVKKKRTRALLRNL